MFLNIALLEKKYKIQFKEIKEWNYLRNYYREISYISNNNKISLYKALKDAFYGFSNWFRSYNYLIFSNSGERKKLYGKFYDTKVDMIIEYLGKDNTLLIETPSPNHYKQSLLPIKYIVSRRLIDLFTVFLEKIFYKTYIISFLEQLNKELNINFNYKKIVRRFNIQYNIYKFWFKIIKPTHIFISCYYDKGYIVKVAHDLEIKIIEIQHGLISPSHSAYYSTIKINHNYIPDYLLSFGKDLKEKRDSTFIFNSKNVFPVGNYYLEYLNNNFKENYKLSKYISNYQIVVGVSLQWTIEKELISMLIKVANSVPEVLFILIPRKWDKKKYKNIKLLKNMMFYYDLDCYQIIMHCNYHCTVYSTCALETPSLGVPNILVNLNNLTNKYMYNITKKNYTFIINNELELINILRKKHQFKKEKVIKNNEFIFVSHYRKNIKKIIEKFKKDIK